MSDEKNQRVGTSDSDGAAVPGKQADSCEGIDFENLHEEEDDPTIRQERLEERRLRLHNAEIPSTRHLRRRLENLSYEQLVDMLVDIGARLAFDEDEEYNPTESVAADSGADFVSSVNETFAKAGFNL